MFRVREQGYHARRVLIVGAGSTGRRLKQKLDIHPEFGFAVVGFLDDVKKTWSYHGEYYEVLGKINDFEDVFQNYKIDRVMIALPLSAHEEILHVTDKCEHEGVEVNIIPHLFKSNRCKVKFFNIDGIPVIGLHSNPVDTRQYLYLKRAFDIVFSFFALGISAPVISMFGLAVKLTSSGPMLFKQRRIGVNGKEFTLYKLRTMTFASADVSDTTWTCADDKRRTKLGIFLRKSCIDELPQFWNVLKGDMSVVGPRPERPHFTKMFKENIPRYMVRHQVKMGITGWAQVSGYRGDTSLSKRIEHDLYYIENWSFRFDLKIIGLTLVRGIWGNHAY